MASSNIYINSSKNLPLTNHSRGLPVPNAIPGANSSQEEVYETIRESELKASQKHESGKLSRS